MAWFVTSMPKYVHVTSRPPGFVRHVPEGSPPSLPAAVELVSIHRSNSVSEDDGEKVAKPEAIHGPWRARSHRRAFARSVGESVTGRRARNHRCDRRRTGRKRPATSACFRLCVKRARAERQRRGDIAVLFQLALLSDGRFFLPGPVAPGRFPVF